MLGWDSDLSFFRVLRVYSTQKKRVAFNISKMLSGQGPEGEVGSTYYFIGAHMCCVCDVCVHEFVFGMCVCVHMYVVFVFGHMCEYVCKNMCVCVQVRVCIQECAHTSYSVLMKVRSQFLKCTVWVLGTQVDRLGLRAIHQPSIKYLII